MIATPVSLLSDLITPSELIAPALHQKCNQINWFGVLITTQR
jgi:hypothetical protein